MYSQHHLVSQFLTRKGAVLRCDELGQSVGDCRKSLLGTLLLDSSFIGVSWSACSGGDNIDRYCLRIQHTLSRRLVTPARTLNTRTRLQEATIREWPGSVVMDAATTTQDAVACRLPSIPKITIQPSAVYPFGDHPPRQNLEHGLSADTEYPLSPKRTV